MGIAVLQEGRLATFHKSRFQAAKRSDMCSAMLQQVRFIDDAQESRFQAANRSEKCSAVMKGLPFGDNQESCFEA